MNEYTVVKFGYSLVVLAPTDRLPDLVNILSECRQVDGGIEKKSSFLSYSIEAVDPEMDNEMSPREKKLEEEAKTNNDRWYKAYQENELLKKQLEELKELAQND
jgi:hypothetical protein